MRIYLNNFTTQCEHFLQFINFVKRHFDFLHRLPQVILLSVPELYEPFAHTHHIISFTGSLVSERVLLLYLSSHTHNRNSKYWNLI